jgi:hypothetical protein
VIDMGYDRLVLDLIGLCAIIIVLGIPILVLVWLLTRD